MLTLFLSFLATGGKQPTAACCSFLCKGEDKAHPALEVKETGDSKENTPFEGMNKAIFLPHALKDSVMGVLHEGCFQCGDNDTEEIFSVTANSYDET